MPRATPINSWKAILQEIGQRPSPKEWEKYGIPENTPYKEAVGLRLFHAIMEEKAYYLIPKLLEYTEPSAKQIDVTVTDWHTKFQQVGMPMSLVAERLRLVLTRAMEEDEIHLIDAPAPTGEPANRIIDAPRSIESDTSRRPDNEVSDAESAGGQETGEIALDSYAETETAE